MHDNKKINLLTRMTISKTQITQLIDSFLVSINSHNSLTTLLDFSGRLEFKQGFQVGHYALKNS